MLTLIAYLIMVLCISADLTIQGQRATCEDC